VGGETVLYRHEKTFVHQTAIAVNVSDTDPPDVSDKTLELVRNYVMERVGEMLRIDKVAVTQKGNDTPAFVALCKKAWDVTERPLVIHSADLQALMSAAEAVKGSRSVLASATKETARPLREAAEKHGHVLAVTAPDLNTLVSLTAGLREEGINDLILHFETHSLAEQFQTNTIARRAALKDNFKPLGYPTLTFVGPGNLLEETVFAVNEISKYGGICVLPSFDAAQVASLMTLRLNIYTDPQKPIQVEPKVYEIGEPKPDSPVFVTTNFSLTYFIVSGEIENCSISAWLVVPECEGMSVLTAWAAGKFTGVTIGKFVREIGLEKIVSSREIVIPGYVAQISGELEENLPGWKVTVGPQEAADLESFIKARLNAG
jgi:acetyl-CoA decarbonylase/synthase complex subunit gamma